MRRLEIPGGIYGEALPSGEYAVLIKSSHVETHLGPIPLPPEEQAGVDPEGRPSWGPLFLRCTDRAGFRFAGQSHVLPGVTWEWAGQWVRLPITACGVNPVIYDRQGVLHISDCAIGSQGWRYVAEDGRLVTGDETYDHPVLRLAEWTQLGDLVIGQGYDGGAIVVRGGERRRLESGDCRFIRLQRDGDQLAVTIVKFPERKTVVLWFTIADLSAFPIDEPPEEPIVVRPFDRLLDFGYFYAYSVRYGDNPSAPGTCTVVVEPEVIPRVPLWLPLIISRSGIAIATRRRWNQVRAIYVSGADTDEAEQEASRARREMKRRALRRRPIIAYIDRPIPSRIPRRGIVGLQCYPDFSPDERLESLRDRILSQLARVPADRSIALICGAYDRRSGDDPGYTDLPELRRIQSLWPALAHLDRRIRYLLPFSDGRPGGTRDHEELRPWHTATVVAIPKE